MEEDLQPQPTVAVATVSKYFKNKQRKLVYAVQDVSFQVPQGEVFGILGPNGSGKSTLIRVVATLLLPDVGSVSVFGHDVTANTFAVPRLINRVSSEASFFKKLSAMENLTYAAGIYGISKSRARKALVPLLLRVGLKEAQISQPMEGYSRGMQQKVAIARAFLTSPILLLLDEPTTGLDPRAKREVQALVREVQNQHGATVLLTTHDMIEAEELCGRIAIMHEGRLVALGTAAELKMAVRHNPGTTDGSAGSRPVTLEEVFLH